MARLVVAALAVLVVCAAVLQADATTTQHKLMAKVASSFALRRASATTETELSATELKEIERMKTEREKAPSSKATMFSVVDDEEQDPFEKAHDDVEAAKVMLKAESLLETKAKKIAGLDKDNEVDMVLVDHLAKKPETDLQRIEDIHKEMDSVRFTERRSDVQQAPATSSTDVPPKQVGLNQMYVNHMQDRAQQENYFSQGRKIRDISYDRSKRSNSERYEDCMACRLIWRQVEMDVANARYVEDVESSFEHNCLDAQKSMIFYKACQDMENDLYAMVDDYMSGQYTVDKMCLRSKMCTVA